MNSPSESERLIEIARIVLTGIIGVLEIPLVIGLFNQNTVGEILGMVISIFILQPLAVAVGLGLGIHPVEVMVIMISFGISVILVLPRICDMFAERSEWLQKNLKKIEAITQKSEMFRKYGMYTFIPFIWVPGVGLYGCVMIAWLFRWKSVRAGAIILAGWILAALIVLMTSIGIVRIFQ
jgi:uncharacterized membrane protein